MHVEKEKIRVNILIDRFRVVGDMYRYPGARLLDLVNAKETAFIALTEVEVYSPADGKLIQTSPFMAVNRNAMTFFYPTEDHEETLE